MTYEEISTKYPVGKTIYGKTEVVVRKGYWITQKDIDTYKSLYKNVRVCSDNTLIYEAVIHHTKTVEGWLFDGKEWYVAEDGWGGWQVIDDDELKKFESERLSFKEF